MATAYSPAPVHPGGYSQAPASFFPPPLEPYQQQPPQQQQQQQQQQPWPTDAQGRPAMAGRLASTGVPGHSAQSVIEATGPAGLTPATSTPFEGTSLKSVRLAAELSLQELINVRDQFPLSTSFSAAGPGSAASDNIHKIRAYHDVALSDLYLLRREISAVAKAAEARRLRKWVFGVLIASFIPAVRKIFRRTEEDHEANDTEYAFSKTRSLLERIRDSVTPGSKTSFLAQMTLFVGAVLYVFQNEVTIRVARTMTKRLKRLAAKVEGGIEVLDEQDVKVLKGWRWRVLL
ncbi:hypothetical protein Micbo1qcDRAFT_165963 [Microdochium bolleyi]|uniref:Uncharacterized protein n=1 Tax=Microdochium bolleyi TaxID=196109 RepID=A0A136IWA2_9PEZI|nr:hypothetical protein Micbo1qcDRAFT_165963 [Microdochium bolleyi]